MGWWRDFSWFPLSSFLFLFKIRYGKIRKRRRSTVCDRSPSRCKNGNGACAAPAVRVRRRICVAHRLRPSCLRPERGNRASATLLHYIHIHVFIIIIIREIIDAQPEKEKKKKKRFKSNHKSSDVGGGIFTKEKEEEGRRLWSEWKRCRCRWRHIIGGIKRKKEYNTQGRRYVDIDVEIEASVFEKAETTLPFLGPVTELHEVADAVWWCHRRRRQFNVSSAHLKPNVLLGSNKTKTNKHKQKFSWWLRKNVCLLLSFVCRRRNIYKQLKYTMCVSYCVFGYLIPHFL